MSRVPMIDTCPASLEIDALFTLGRPTGRDNARYTAFLRVYTELLGQQQANLLQNLARCCVWQGTAELHGTGLPIQTLDLIRQNDATNG